MGKEKQGMRNACSWMLKWPKQGCWTQLLVSRISSKKFTGSCWAKDSCGQAEAENSLSVHMLCFKNKSGFFLKLMLQFWKLPKHTHVQSLAQRCRVLPVSMAIWVWCGLLFGLYVGQSALSTWIINRKGQLPVIYHVKNIHFVNFLKHRRV